MVDPAQPVTVTGVAPRYVGRGGDKLEAALDRFGIDPAGRTALDAGASTGGFTDCLLQHGARLVVAVDVGRNQLHERLRVDPRVLSLERTNVRHLGPTDLADAPFSLVVADLSFISLRTVAPALVPLARPGADVVVLVKPQFEAGRQEVSAGRGVVRNPDIWRRVLIEVASAWESQGATMMEAMVSPLRGADGNVEFLAHLRPGASARTPWDPDAAVAAGRALAGL
jgi:23S rRNA (cytidine1920-2'-O)/16S rRNA (cytidine1409-2'-O)-methyltransferase